MKWTKTDIETLCNCLFSFYVVNRPLSHVGYDVAMEKIRASISEHRKDIVLDGIRSARQTCAARYRTACETIGNQIVRFTEYGKPDELIDRFTRLAREEDTAEKKLEALLHRMLDEGLPPEVEAYDPVSIYEKAR
jgi:hypothetical protein